MTGLMIKAGERQASTPAAEQLAELRAAFEAEARCMKVASTAVEASKKPAWSWLLKWVKGHR